MASQHHEPVRCKTGGISKCFSAKAEGIASVIAKQQPTQGGAGRRLSFTRHPQNQRREQGGTSYRLYLFNNITPDCRLLSNILLAIRIREMESGENQRSLPRVKAFCLQVIDSKWRRGWDSNRPEEFPFRNLLIPRCHRRHPLLVLGWADNATECGALGLLLRSRSHTRPNLTRNLSRRPVHKCPVFSGPALENNNVALRLLQGGPPMQRVRNPGVLDIRASRHRIFCIKQACLR